MTAASLMNPNPTILHPDDKIITAARFIMENRHRSLAVVRAFELGASDYILKPFSPTELTVRVERLLGM